jgi:hypothetical protein
MRLCRRAPRQSDKGVHDLAASGKLPGVGLFLEGVGKPKRQSRGKPGTPVFTFLDGALGRITFPDQWIDGRGPYDVAVDVGEVDGVIDCVGVAVRSGNRDLRVDARLLRWLSKERFLQPAVALVASSGLVKAIEQSIENEGRPAGLYDQLDAKGRTWYATLSHAKAAQEEAKQWRRIVRQASRVGGDELLEAVAAIYLRAERRGEHPNKAVVKAFKVPDTTAISYVRRARGAGLLPKTTQGRTRARRTEERS